MSNHCSLITDAPWELASKHRKIGSEAAIQRAVFLKIAGGKDELTVKQLQPEDIGRSSWVWEAASNLAPSTGLGWEYMVGDHNVVVLYSLAIDAKDINRLRKFRVRHRRHGNLLLEVDCTPLYLPTKFRHSDTIRGVYDRWEYPVRGYLQMPVICDPYQYFCLEFEFAQPAPCTVMVGGDVIMPVGQRIA